MDTNSCDNHSFIKRVNNKNISRIFPVMKRDPNFSRYTMFDLFVNLPTWHIKSTYVVKGDNTALQRRLKLLASFVFVNFGPFFFPPLTLQKHSQSYRKTISLSPHPPTRLYRFLTLLVRIHHRLIHFTPPFPCESHAPPISHTSNPPNPTAPIKPQNRSYQFRSNIHVQIKNVC